MRIRYSSRRNFITYTEVTRHGEVQMTEWQRTIEGRSYVFMVAVCPEGTVYASAPKIQYPEDRVHMITFTRSEILNNSRANV